MWVNYRVPRLRRTATGWKSAADAAGVPYGPVNPGLAIPRPAVAAPPRAANYSYALNQNQRNQLYLAASGGRGGREGPDVDVPHPPVDPDDTIRPGTQILHPPPEIVSLSEMDRRERERNPVGPKQFPGLSHPPMGMPGEIQLGEQIPSVIDPGEFWKLYKQLIDGGVGETQAYSMAVDYYQKRNPKNVLPRFEEWTGTVPRTRAEQQQYEQQQAAYKAEAENWINNSIETIMRDQKISREWAAYELYQMISAPGSSKYGYFQAVNPTVQQPGQGYLTQQERDAARTRENRWAEERARYGAALSPIHQRLSDQFQRENPMSFGDQKSPEPRRWQDVMSNTWMSERTKDLFRRSAVLTGPGSRPNYMTRFDRDNAAFKKAMNLMRRDWHRARESWFRSQVQVPPVVSGGAFPA